MAKDRELGRSARPPVSRSLAVGALVGGSVGLVGAARMASGLSALPLASQLTSLAAAWYVAAIVGLVVAAVVEVCSRVLARAVGTRAERPIWPGAVVVAVLIWIEMTSGGPVAHSHAYGALAAVLAIAAALVLAALASRLPWLKGRLFWGVVNLAALLVLLVFVSIAGPWRHGTHVLGAVAALPALAIAAWPVVGEVRRGRRAITACLLGVVVALGALWLLGPAVAGAARAADAASPNILLVTVDTLRADHLGCYGNETVRTPNIDRLAREGVLFETAICPEPLTNPSHTTIVTGLHPGNHGVTLNRGMPIRPHVTTLSDVLSRRGYKTAAFVSGYTLKGTQCSLSERFELYDDDFSPVSLIPEGCISNGTARLLMSFAHYLGLVPRVQLGQRRAGPALESAKRWLDSNSDGPFFLWVHFFDPHGGYEPPPPYDRLYDPDYSGTVGGDWYSLSPERRLELTEKPRELAHIKACYAGEVSYADEKLGGLMDALARLDLVDRTLVVFTSDHGESLTEHDYYFDHSVCLYDPSLRVPLIFRLPRGTNAGARRTGLVQLTDVFPTVLGFLGLPEPEGLDGHSLLPYLVTSEDGSSSKVAVSAVFQGDVEGGKSLISVRTATHKYIRTSSWFGDNLLIGPSEEIYDLTADPGELENVLDDRPEALEPLRAIAADYWQAWFVEDRAEPGPAPSEQSQEILRSLGYTQ